MHVNKTFTLKITSVYLFFIKYMELTMKYKQCLELYTIFRAIEAILKF